MLQLAMIESHPIFLFVSYDKPFAERPVLKIKFWVSSVNSNRIRERIYCHLQSIFNRTKIVRMVTESRYILCRQGYSLYFLLLFYFLSNLKGLPDQHEYIVEIVFPKQMETFYSGI